MADATINIRSLPPPAPFVVLPRPRQLEALGTVLCLYRPQHGSELAGWTQAVRAEVRARVDSDGLRESLLFYDRAGQCCWRLCLLPDSDFFAWDRMVAPMSRSNDKELASGVGERLWRRLAGRLRGDSWRAHPVRLHALSDRSGRQSVLAASLAPVSALGAATVRRIVRNEDIHGDARLDDCMGMLAPPVAQDAAWRAGGAAWARSPHGGPA